MTDKGNYSVAGNCKFRRWFNTIWQNSLIQKPVGQPTPGAPTADPRQNIRIIRTFDRQMRPAKSGGNRCSQNAGTNHSNWRPALRTAFAQVLPPRFELSDPPLRFAARIQ